MRKTQARILGGPGGDPRRYDLGSQGPNPLWHRCSRLLINYNTGGAQRIARTLVARTCRCQPLAIAYTRWALTCDTTAPAAGAARAVVG